MPAYGKLCIYCAQGFPEECVNTPPCPNVPSSAAVESAEGATINSDRDLVVGPGRPRKPDEEVEHSSTGRRRANVDFPIDREAACEWQNLANCGGGNHPIMGCPDGKQEHNHHGPNKDVLANFEGNVHRICTNCHNRWHAVNNKDYDPEIPHNPIPLKEFVRQYFQLLKYNPFAIQQQFLNVKENEYEGE